MIQVGFPKREHLGWALKDEQNLTKSRNTSTRSIPGHSHTLDSSMLDTLTDDSSLLVTELRIELGEQGLLRKRPGMRGGEWGGGVGGG